MHRYIPIDYWIKGTAINATNLRFHGIPNQSEVFIGRPLVYRHYAETHHTYMPIVIYAVTALMMALMVYIVVAYIIHRQSPTLGKPLDVPGKRGFQDLLLVNYSYEGIAKVLRELFLDIKSRVGSKLCSRACTPREFAQTYKHERLFQRFANTYEDVVYGRRIPENVDDIIHEMRRHLNEIK